MEHVKKSMYLINNVYTYKSDNFVPRKLKFQTNQFINLTKTMTERLKRTVASLVAKATPKTAVLMLMLMVMTLPAMAQGLKVKGTVLDSSGEPIIGATVMQKGNSKVGTTTDFDGNFEITVPSNKSILVLSYVGMKTKEVQVTSQPMKITLVDDQAQLEELVVVGYGQQKKASVVGAITQTTGKVLERAGGVSNIGAALTGNLPGVVTMTSSGTPGDEDPKIVIRGVSSWNNSDPLVLVDGVERSLGSIDITTVESISVLKDASATAVYGVKGANGVILVTTKRGQEGKAKIEVGFQATAKVVSKLPGTYNSPDALTLRNQAAEYELGLVPASWDKVLPMDIIDKYRNPANLAEAERYPNVDWQDALFKDMAMSYNPNVNISGGTKNVKYFASLDYLHEGDLFREYENGRGYQAGYGFDRINVRSNLDFKITKTTNLKVNLFGSHGQKRGGYGVESGSFGESQLWQAAYSTPPNSIFPVYSNGMWGYYKKDDQGAANSALNLAYSGVNKTTTTRINTDFTLEQDLSMITPGLRANATISWDNAFVETNRGINDQFNSLPQGMWIDPVTGEIDYRFNPDSKTNLDYDDITQWKIDGGSVQNWNTQRNLFYQGQLFWGRQFGKHNVTAMGVFNRTERTWGNQFTNYREDWAFRMTYNFADRYFFEYNGAYNGSEKFAKENRFAFFNSGAIGWMISEEKFFKPIKKYVDMLKVRYSYGEVGDDNVFGGARWLYATQWSYGGSIAHGNNAHEGSPFTFYKESSVGNPDVHWEKSTKQNLGIDYGFFGGLLAGSLEFFRDDRKDVLIGGGNRAVPSYFGAVAPVGNLGKVKSTGYELELRVNKTLNNGLRLWGNFNMTHAENVVKVYDDRPKTPSYQKTQGFAIGQDHATLDHGFANTWDEVYAITAHNTNDNQKLPGQYATIDYNGDGIIDQNDSAPYGYTGTPQNTYSASIGAEWKGFSVFVQFYGVTNVNRYVHFTSLNKNLDTVYDEGTFWSKWALNADAPMPRIASTPSYYEGTRTHYDGSFIRLKNAEIAYTFSGKWLQTVGLSSLRVFLNGNNIWVWSHMPDDRESNFAGTGLASQGAYPTVKRFNLGIKLGL